MEVSSIGSDGAIVMSTDSPSTNAGSETSILLPGSTFVFSFTSDNMVAPLYQPRFRRFRFSAGPPRREAAIPGVALGLEVLLELLPLLGRLAAGAKGVEKLYHRH